MQYFTFIGLGPNDGYKTVCYVFDRNEEFMVESKFVQSAILQKYVDEVDEIIAFCTNESFKKYYADFEKEMLLIKPDISIKERRIDKDIDFNEFLKLIDEMVVEGDMIIDITHSFRVVPIVMLLSMQYLQQSHGTHVRHLFYGELNEEKSIGRIKDIIDDYRLASLASGLHQFDLTLRGSFEEFIRYYKDDDRYFKIS